MLSIQFIEKVFQAQDYDRLLRELCRNGLVMPLSLRVRFSGSPMGAAALGLRRLVELTYGPTEFSLELSVGLIDAVQPGLGVLDSEGHACPVLTAAVAAGLGRMVRDHGPLLEMSEGRSGGRSGGLFGAVAEGGIRGAAEQACHQAIEALAQMQSGDGLFAGWADRSPADRLLASAFIAYLLLDDPAFSARCSRHALLTALEEARDHASRPAAELIDMARMSGVPVPSGGPFLPFVTRSRAVHATSMAPPAVVGHAA